MDPMMASMASESARVHPLVLVNLSVKKKKMISFLTLDWCRLSPELSSQASFPVKKIEWSQHTAHIKFSKNNTGCWMVFEAGWCWLFSDPQKIKIKTPNILIGVDTYSFRPTSTSGHALDDLRTKLAPEALQSTDSLDKIGWRGWILLL